MVPGRGLALREQSWSKPKSLLREGDHHRSHSREPQGEVTAMSKRHNAIQAMRGMAHLLRRRALLTLLLSLVVALSVLPSGAERAAGARAGDLAAQLDTYLSGLATHDQFS